MSLSQEPSGSDLIAGYRWSYPHNSRRGVSRTGYNENEHIAQAQWYSAIHQP